MDASPSNAFVHIDADVYSDYGLLLKSEISMNPNIYFTLKQKNTVKKYTKLPEFDLDSKGRLPHQNNTSQPRLRRFITINEPMTISNRPLSSEAYLTNQKMATNLSKRKIVTIVEGEEHDHHPRFSNNTNVNMVKTVSRSIAANFKPLKSETREKTKPLHNTLHNNNLKKYSRESKPSAKLNTYDAKDLKPNKYSYRRKPPNISTENNKPNMVKLKDVPISKPAKSHVYKKTVPPTENEKQLLLIKNKRTENFKLHPEKKLKDKVKLSNLLLSENKRNQLLLPMDFQHVPDVIHVPLDVNPKVSYSLSSQESIPQNCSNAQITSKVIFSDAKISTDTSDLKLDKSTMMEPEPQITYKYLHSTDVQTELIKETFDSLEIPNVTLTKPESDDESRRSKSLLNIPLHPFKNTEDDSAKPNVLMSSSYIISRATLTYTTEQKFDLQVVGSNDDAYSNQTSPMSYPINVVSVFKEMQSEDSTRNIAVNDNNRKRSKRYKNHIHNLKSLDCSYDAHINKLMKPSDMISTIRVNNSWLESDYIYCDQFQRELNFIDSFFESLMYLESSLTENFSGVKVDSSISRQGFKENTDKFGFDNLLSIEASAADSETMASKNLFLLNILIRDEQRRAKNLLFVLKRREDALKDFTKSQILYLENKKRQDNTDISALKKKQRGALLKLQHECGEMQRMRRALLTLSEKRKLALMKTKKDLELKLKNNVDVDKIILSKKNVKRSASIERASPLKCFDLSSSGCEDSSTSRRHSVETLSPERVCAKPIVSAEKSIQTGDIVEQTTNTDENFIIVDGGYLNILFHNLSLPRIFSSGKQYEVNEPALKNIVDSSNTLLDSHNKESVHTLIDNLKNRDSDVSSTPSTARSLLDEFDQYYNVLHSKYDDRSSSEPDCNICISEIKDAGIQSDSADMKALEQLSTENTTTLKNKIVGVDRDVSDNDIKVVEPCECEAIHKGIMESIRPVEPCDCDVTQEESMESVGTLENCDCDVIDKKSTECKEVSVISPTGPLPVPAGEAAVSDPAVTDVVSWLPLSTTSSRSTSLYITDSSIPDIHLLDEQHELSRSEPSISEAEELRRQQLAIEKEIKELEQQQCLVVREIPDKPPPPYTPPAPPRKFQADQVTMTRISMYMNVEDYPYTEPKEAFDVFVHDFCKEALDRTRQEESDLPWDAFNLAPPKPSVDHMKLLDTTAADLKQVLAGAKPTVVCGVSTRRLDHIDDVLFAEWRRVEPEWTSLHYDEAIVKNSVFESIFQRILSDTVDEYKRTVLSNDLPSE